MIGPFGIVADCCNRGSFELERFVCAYFLNINHGGHSVLDWLCCLSFSLLMYKVNIGLSGSKSRLTV
jgi:hypothetical protein